MALPRSTPLAQGVDARGLLDLLDAAERDDLGLHGLVVARHGHAVAAGWWAPYAEQRVHLAYSLSKTLTATAIGLLVDEGRLSVTDRVLDHLPDADRTSAAPGWEHVLVEHCLSMTVGHDTDAWTGIMADVAVEGWPPGDDWLPRVLATELDHEPGTQFAYNQVATYLLSLVVRALSGTGLTEVLRHRLLDPLGIEELPWHRDPRGRELGYSGAHLTTDGIASLAQLYLDEGLWDGRRLLDAEWVARATIGYGPLNREPDASPDWCRGYGYSFWMQRHGFRGDGAFGQFLVVLPEQDAVVAITSENDRMQATLDALWEHLVPALDREGSAEADAELAERLASLAIPALSGSHDRGAEAEVTTSELGSAWTRARVDGSRLLLRRGEQELAIEVGDGTWAETTLEADGFRLPVAASGGWADEDTWRADVLLVETPHRVHVEVRRDGTASLRWRYRPLSGPDPFHSAVREA